MLSNKFLVDTLLYFDIFGFAPNLDEFHRFLIGYKISKKELKKTLNASEDIESKNGFYFLKLSKTPFEQRIIRNAISEEKRILAMRETKILSKIPTIKSIVLSGSVACNNAREEDDIDLFIITAPHSVWVTRFLVYLWLKITRKIRGKIIKNNLFCPNMFVDQNISYIDNKNLYNASEIVHLQPLYDRDNSFGHFMNSNSWIQEFFPNFPLEKKKHIKNARSRIALLILNNFLYRIQTIPMKKKISNETIAVDRIQFHPNNLSLVILKLWEARKSAYYGSYRFPKLTRVNQVVEIHDHTPGS